MNADLHIIAERLRKQADALDGKTCGPVELATPHFLRERAAEYEKAQREMAEWQPYPHANTLDPRPSRAIIWTARAALAGAILTLLYLVVML